MTQEPERREGGAWIGQHPDENTEQVREQLDEWAGLGVDELIVGAGAVPFALASPDDVEMIAAACSLAAPCPASDPLN